MTVKKIYSIILLVTLLFIGCGGGGGSEQTISSQENIPSNSSTKDTISESLIPPQMPIFQKKAE